MIYKTNYSSIIPAGSRAGNEMKSMLRPDLSGRAFFYQCISGLLYLSAIYHYSTDREIGVQSPSLANKNTCQPNAANAMNFLLNDSIALAALPFGCSASYAACHGFWLRSVAALRCFVYVA
jgi:hypothetical protein